jgi:hypothetical protein
MNYFSQLISVKALKMINLCNETILACLCVGTMTLINCQFNFLTEIVRVIKKKVKQIIVMKALLSFDQ